MVQERRCFHALKLRDDGWAGRRLIWKRKNRSAGVLGGVDGADVAGEAADHVCRSVATPNDHGRERKVGEHSEKAVVADDGRTAAVVGVVLGAGSADERAVVGSWWTVDMEDAGCMAREEAENCLACEGKEGSGKKKRVEASGGWARNASCCFRRARHAGLEDRMDAEEVVDDWRIGEVDDGCGRMAGVVVRDGLRPLMTMARLNANQANRCWS